VPGILVVDDEPEILKFVGDALKEEGYDVQTAVDGRQAIDIASRDRPDLVVLDIRLPRLDGHGVARELRRLYGNVPILVMTADGRAQEKARTVGAFDFLPKPFDLDHLFNVIRGCLNTP